VTYPRQRMCGLKMVERVKTPAQLVTEIVCRHKAAKDGVELGHEFWKEPKWEAYFRQQITTANTLLRMYSFNAVYKALQDKRAAKIYSLRAPWLDDIIKEYEVAEKKMVQRIDTKPVEFTPRRKGGLRDE